MSSKSTMKNKISPTSPPNLSMSNFKSSSNYLWNTNAVLGKGATGAVYFGHNKHCGETVAVKCFNHLSHMRPYEVQKREFEVLKKVNHENIVKLLAIEEENDTKQKVLVMELCTGGSLFNILDDPLNSSGLEEKEFLLVLKHLAAGMKHLRDMNIIHRDLKPGNIMKFVTEDGTSIYKLTDFGAARELDDDQQFMSLYGTEEYLHPDMYERAVLRKPVGKSFKANVDLWSIGVTLYHIATGSLPFRPYGGRKNKETMYKITTEKASGIISGTQTSENGEIKWNCNLPETCLLSPSVQPLVTELLAGLLECDAHRMWSFEKFFSSVTNILEHRVVFVFYVGTLSLYSIYCHSSQKIIELKSKFESMFNIDSKDQILIWSNDELNQINSMASNINNILFSDVKLSSYNLISNAKRCSATNSLNSNGLTIVPDDLLLTELGTTENVPLFLLNGQINSKIRSLTGPIILSKFPDIATSPANTDVDAQFAKLCSSLAYAMLRQVDRFVHNYKLACTIPAHMLKLINRNIKHLNKKQSSIHFHYNIFKERLEATLYMNNTISQLIKSMSDNNKILDSNIRGLQLPNIDHIKAQFDKIEYNLKSLTSSSIMDEKLEQLIDLWPSAKEFDNTRRLIAAQSKAKIYTAKIRESWLLLHKDKQIKSLNFHEEQLHQLEKMKLDNFCKKLNDLIMKEINPCLTIADKLEEWYQGAQVAYVKPQLIISELTDFLPSIHNMEQELQIGKDDQLKVLNCLLQQLNEFRCDSNSGGGGIGAGLGEHTALIKSLEQQIRSKQQSQSQPNQQQSSSLNRNNNNSSLIDALSTLNGNIDPDTQLFREIISLRESTKALKDAFRDYELVFSEVESFTPGSG